MLIDFIIILIPKFIFNIYPLPLHMRPNVVRCSLFFETTALAIIGKIDVIFNALLWTPIQNIALGMQAISSIASDPSTSAQNQRKANICPITKLSSNNNSPSSSTKKSAKNTKNPSLHYKRQRSKRSLKLLRRWVQSKKLRGNISTLVICSSVKSWSSLSTYTKKICKFCTKIAGLWRRVYSC